MRLGFHIPIAGGWVRALQRAVILRCTCLQVFTSAPVQWARKPLDPVVAPWFGQALRALDIQPLFVHAIYLLNLASEDRELWRRSRAHLAEELNRAALLGARGVVVHLGSAAGSEDDRCGTRVVLQRVARALDYALARGAPGVQILLENCAGQGSLVGCTPASLADIIARTRHPDRLAVCLDTAHALAHGYAIHTPEGLDALLTECGDTFGLERLQLIHANDSKAPVGSRTDRHWHIGRGHIGRAGFRVILNDSRLRHLPFIMETPASQEWDPRNMRALRAAVAREYRPPLPALRPVPPPP